MMRRMGMDVGQAVVERAGRMFGDMQEAAPLAADLLESDDEYRVVFDAPGAEPADVQVRYVDGAVLVRVDRFRTFYEGFEMRFPGRGLALDGRMDLPRDAAVDPAAGSATLRDDGTLVVRIPKVADETDEAAGSDD